MSVAVVFLLQPSAAEISTVYLRSYRLGPMIPIFGISTASISLSLTARALSRGAPCARVETTPVADVAFMYVLAVLSMVKIYQARHPDVNARAHATFGVLALLIAIGKRAASGSRAGVPGQFRSRSISTN